MAIHDHEVTIKLKSRPLRCAYLVRDREELLDAIALYTHIWGGAANAILPLPRNDEEINSFKSILEWMNPDYIFIPRETLSSQVSQVLEKLPIIVRPISKVEIQRHISSGGGDLLQLGNGWLSYIGFVLSAIHQSKPENSAMRLLDVYDSFKLEIALHAGLPAQPYRDYLVRYLGASTFSNLENSEFLLKTLLTITKFFNLPALTLVKTRKSYDGFNPYLMQTSDEETLCLFLDDGNDLGIATAFWNCRWIFPANKIFLPRQHFLENINNHALQILELMPYIRAVQITTPLNREEALDLCNDTKQVFLEFGKEVLVKINYRDFRFDWVSGTLFSGKVVDITRAVTSEECVRFEPITPIGHENTDFIFAYDAEVKFKSGVKFFSPQTLAASHLLTNELWRLENSEVNKDNFGKLWLRRLPVRTTFKGITGLALPGKECSFFIHPDNVIITRQLKEIGFELKPNEHTRYAQGLVKRLGGISEVTSLINDGGSDILSVLAADRADQEGLKKKKILSALIQKRSFNQEQANTIISQKLMPLLASDLLRRGYSHKCRHCNLITWLSLEEVKEFIECKGCVEREQLPLDNLEFTYKPNELAAQLIREGGLAVLMTAATLRRIPISSSSFIQFGGDFLNIQNKTKFAEVDLFWLTEEALIISECKSLFSKKAIDENEIQEKIERTRESLLKNLDVAKRIRASAVILGVLTNLSDISNLLDMVANMAEIAKNEKIALHLILNEKIYLWGNPNGIDPRAISLNNLLIEEQNLPIEWSVGKSPSNYGGTVGSNGIFDKDVLQLWDSDLKL